MIKTLIKKVLGFFGISISRTNNSRNIDPFLLTQEWANLSSVINEFFRLKRVGFSWASPESVLGYLSPYRIRQYHSLTKTCDELNIPLSSSIVADVGTGVGYFLRHLHEHYNPKELWGFDMKVDDLEIAAHLCPSAKLEKKSFEDLPKGKFDVVFLMQVLEHVITPAEVIRTIMKSLRPGGRLIITVPDGRTDQLIAGEFYPSMNSYWGHINFWSIESWDIFMDENFRDMMPKTGALPVETSNLFAILKNPPSIGCERSIEEALEFGNEIAKF